MKFLKCQRTTQPKAGVLMLGLAIIATLATWISPPANAQEGSGLAAPIEGSWVIFVTPPAGGPATPFTGISSFAAGGVWLATGSNDRLPGNQISELHGTWQKTGQDTYEVTAYFLAFDPAGHPLGILHTNEVFRLTSYQEFIGVASLSVCDLQNANCVPLPGVSTITGKRVELEGDFPSL
jgi:hypothetical protein